MDNYAHASIFGQLTDALMANRYLVSQIQEDSALFEQLKQEQYELISLLKGEKKIFQPLLEPWSQFVKIFPEYAEWPLESHLPYKTWMDDFALPEITFDSAKIPLLFLEPVKGLESLLERLKSKPALFILETKGQLKQMMPWLDALLDPTHGIFVLEMYPEEQTSYKKFQHAEFEASSLLSNKLPFQELLQAFSKPDELYYVAKRWLKRVQVERLGPSRLAAIINLWDHKNWRDPHKGLPDKPIAEFKTYLQTIERLKRKFKIVHVVSNVIDGGHAPSQILEILIEHHNPEIDVSVISTELYHLYPGSYPYTWIVSESSEKRGSKRLRRFATQGVPTTLLPAFNTYEEAAKELAYLLEKERADAVIFHGPNVVNYLAAHRTATPLRVLFEHGTQPDYPGFDVAIVSSQSALDIYKNLFEELQIKAYPLPFAVDRKANWTKEAPTKESLGFPCYSKLLTTISNHLDHRLSAGTCRAIADILMRVPDAIYAPMGHIFNPEKIKAYFASHGVAERIHFFGAVDNPSNFARACDLYLNEFPFGSGLGILDAMAAGCPVVTMYDPNGPQQARYGGEYMGLDHAVHSLQWQDYSNLACDLLTNPSLYATWSAHAQCQYEKRTDVIAYVRHFEQIVKSHFS